jgi:hypothetical protein
MANVSSPACPGPDFTDQPTVHLAVNDGYPEPDLDRLSDGSLHACFSGILRHIFMRTGKQYNTTELQLSWKTQSASPDANPAFALDYETQERYGTGPSTSDQFFAVRFRQMTVLPVAYAIRSDHFPQPTNRLRSWAFQAREPNGMWITLDEHEQAQELMKPGSYLLAFVETDTYFTEFRILQTGPSRAHFLSFNICGIEIHGFIKRL